MSLSTFAALAFFFRTIGSPTPAPRRAAGDPRARGRRLGARKSERVSLSAHYSALTSTAYATPSGFLNFTTVYGSWASWLNSVVPVSSNSTWSTRSSCG